MDSYDIKRALPALYNPKAGDFQVVEVPELWYLVIEGHGEGPLEGLWSAEDPAAFVAADKSAWDWTMMISQPSWISGAVIDTAQREMAEKRRDPHDRVRFAPYAEGTSVQILHIGSYDSEAPALARLHNQ